MASAVGRVRARTRWGATMRSGSFSWCVSSFVVSVFVVVAPHGVGAADDRSVDSGLIGSEASLLDDFMAPHRQPVQLFESGPADFLVLEPFQVFAHDAQIVIHRADGDATMGVPANRYFKGHVAGWPDSRAYVAALEGGEIRGLVSGHGVHWVIRGSALPKSTDWRIESRRVEADVELGFEAAAFDCGTDALPLIAEPSASTDGKGGTVALATKAVTYTARVAVETDNEFFNKFGNATDATNYVADIIAYGSLLYGAEANTSWLLQYLSLWSQGQTDPWVETNPGCGLYEYGRNWNDNNDDISRTTAAFFSGKSTNSGIAWVGVLCGGEFNASVENLRNSQGVIPCTGALTPTVDNYGGAYAYVGGMDGNFDINNPAVIWDIVAVTHEIGHNFNSPHTHCYANIGGNADQVDHCYAGEYHPTYRPNCYTGTTGLPTGCPGNGEGCGTIMSYCHQLYPGMSNLSLTLGLGHPFGVEPERVPERMYSHVASQASSYPGCLDYEVEGTVFTDGFETSNTNSWSATVP